MNSRDRSLMLEFLFGSSWMGGSTFHSMPGPEIGKMFTLSVHYGGPIEDEDEDPYEKDELWRDQELCKMGKGKNCQGWERSTPEKKKRGL